MSSFLNQAQLLQLLRSEVAALKAQVKAVAQGSKVRQTGAAAQRVGVPQTHNHTGTGEGGTLPGVGGGVAAYRARARRSGNQSIPNATWTKIQFDVEDYDPYSDYDHVTNYRYTVPVAGRYLIIGNVHLDMANAGKFIIIAIYVNGTEVCRGIRIRSHDAGVYGVRISDIRDLSASDYVEIFIFHNDGAAQNASSSSYFAIHIQTGEGLISVDEIVDADADTGIEAEQSADEDKLRFRTAGVARAVLDDEGFDLAVPALLSNIQLDALTELTLDASGDIYPTQIHHSVDTYLDASLDDLDTAKGLAVGDAGRLLFITANHTDRTVRVKHFQGADGFFFVDGRDAVLDDNTKTILFRWSGVVWVELARNFPYASERVVEILIPLTKPLTASADTDALDGYHYRERASNITRRLSKLWVRFASNVGGDVTLKLQNNGSDITGASITVSSGNQVPAAVVSFTEETLTDDDVITVVQTTARTDDIVGVVYVYGDEDVVSVAT